MASDTDVQIEERTRITPLSPADRSGPAYVGERLRERRMVLRLSVRELARRLSLSPSLISQIERGKTTPSVTTLYAWTSELGLSMDGLFAGDAAQTAPEHVSKSVFAEVLAGHSDAPLTPVEHDPVVRPSEREGVQIASGVRWDRLIRSNDSSVEHYFVEYEPGGASCDASALIRHTGHEYGYVMSGILEVTLGFRTHTVGPGDAISFPSTMPHRLAAAGGEPVHAIWFVVGRYGDRHRP
ncbi:MAG: helix-turn-helix domain-containing protein [Solirubrobacteraceae bacterium]